MPLVRASRLAAIVLPVPGGPAGRRERAESTRGDGQHCMTTGPASTRRCRAGLQVRRMPCSWHGHDSERQAEDRPRLAHGRHAHTACSCRAALAHSTGKSVCAPQKSMRRKGAPRCCLEPIQPTAAAKPSTQHAAAHRRRACGGRARRAASRWRSAPPASAHGPVKKEVEMSWGQRM